MSISLRRRSRSRRVGGRGAWQLISFTALGTEGGSVLVPVCVIFQTVAALKVFHVLCKQHSRAPWVN